MAKKRPVAARNEAVGTSWVRNAQTKKQVELYIAMLQTVAELQRQFNDLFKDEDLSWAQYNVLRILRGAGPAGRCVIRLAGDSPPCV